MPLRSLGSTRNSIAKLRTSADLALKIVHYQVLVIWRTKAFWLRALICWMIGAILLSSDETNNFDLRLKIRGPQPGSSQIVLIDVSERDWADLDPATRNVLRPLKEVISFTDAFFWNQKAWRTMLSKILTDDPKSIGVTFFFGENVGSPHLNTLSSGVFYDPRIVWSADVDNSGRILVPLFASTYNNNVGLRAMRTDEDGSVRRFTANAAQGPALAVRVAEVAEPKMMPWISRRYKHHALINYTGSVLDSSYKVINARDLIEGRVPLGEFKDKIVLIGSLGNSAEQVQTPVGRMSRTEVLANTVDNIINQTTIRRMDRSVYLVLLFVLLMSSIWILANYPQSVSLIVFIMAGIIWAAASAFAFDIGHIWIPVLSPLVELTAACIVFLSYQLAINERRTWHLEQEQRYVNEIEQLKTNFVSMMSHDLKTPIAKIQAICDRMLTTSKDPEIAVDLKTLRRSSDELHRYIQSILQVTKVEAKDFKIQKEVTDINEDIERVVSRLQPLAHEKNITIRVNLEPMFSIEADTTLIQEVIHNLIENAVKYTPAGGVVTVISQEKDDNVIVVIEDTGPGIALEDQREIWGKFTRGKNHSMEIKGSGLGLYLVKYFIELHGGQVFLESIAQDGAADGTLEAPLQTGTRIGFSIPIADESHVDSLDDAFKAMPWAPEKGKE